MTGCVYSKACNFLVTVGTDCDGKIKGPLSRIITAYL